MSEKHPKRYYGPDGNPDERLCNRRSYNKLTDTFDLWCRDPKAPNDTFCHAHAAAFRRELLKFTADQN